MYVKVNGTYAKDFKPYLSLIENKPLVDNEKFIALLKKSAKDSVMQKTQDEFFDEFYWYPALKWTEDHGFDTPLSILTIYDSFVHSGGILVFLRNKFKEPTPENGGDETEWIKQYLTVRKNWLANHSRKILRKTVYRINDIQQAVYKNDWELKFPFTANGITLS